MGQKNYSVGLMKLVKMSKNGNRQARLLLAMTDLTRVFDTIDPENAVDSVKKDMSDAFISNADGDAKTARRNIRKVVHELTMVKRWIKEMA